MAEHFETDRSWEFMLEFTISPFLDSLEERDAGPRETLELIDYFGAVFEDQLVHQVETRYSEKYEEMNPDGTSIYLKRAYFDPVAKPREGGEIIFTADEEPDEEEFSYVREALEPALNYAFGNWVISSSSDRGGIGDRLGAYPFRPTYTWEDGKLVIDEDTEGTGPVLEDVEERLPDAETY